MLTGCGLLVAFVAIRFLNIYGDAAWFVVEGSPLRTAMSFFALTKYPPSLLFLMFTLGIGTLLLAGFERMREGWLTSALAVFGGAPMFFYILHLIVLRLLYHGALAIYGPTQGSVFGISNYLWIFVWYAALIVPLYLPTAHFSRFKARRRDIRWLKYL